MNMHQRILTFLGEHEYVTFEELLHEYEFRDSDEISDVLSDLIKEKHVQEVGFDHVTWYQRTVTGRVWLTGEKPYTDDTDIPF